MICRPVTAASEIVGRVTVFEESPLNWLTVFPLRAEKSRGRVLQPVQVQVVFMLRPNLTENAGAVASAAVKQAPVLLIRFKLELPPIDRMSPWRYPAHLAPVEA